MPRSFYSVARIELSTVILTFLILNVICETVISSQKPRSPHEERWRSGKVYGNSEDKGVPTWYEVDLYKTKSGDETESRDGRSSFASSSKSAQESSARNVHPYHYTLPATLAITLFAMGRFNFLQ